MEHYVTLGILYCWADDLLWKCAQINQKKSNLRRLEKALHSQFTPQIGLIGQARMKKISLQDAIHALQ